MKTQNENPSNLSVQPRVQPENHENVGRKGGELREKMPEITAWIDDLRKVFGAESINKQIRAGMAGDPVFWAEENGYEIGTRPRVDG